MNEEQAKKVTDLGFTIISVEQDEINPDLNKTHFKTADVKDFYILIALSIKCLAKKMDIEFEKFSDMFTALMLEDTVVGYAIEKVRAEEEDTLL